MAHKDKSGDIASTIKNTMWLGLSELGKAIKGGAQKDKTVQKELDIAGTKILVGKPKGNQITVREENREKKKREVRGVIEE